VTPRINETTAKPRSRMTRVPIAINEVEDAMLEKLADIEQRSKAGMARIIYLAGLKEFAGKAQQANDR